MIILIIDKNDLSLSFDPTHKNYKGLDHVCREDL